jgi:hypothetical protein
MVRAANPLNSTPNPVVTALAGFAALVFPFLERFFGLGFVADGSAVDPVVTSLAGFAGARRPQAPGGRTPMPAAFR